MGSAGAVRLEDDGEHVHSAASLSLDVLLSVFRHLTILELVDALAVCTHWRNTIESSPALWANLDLINAGHRAFSRSMLQPLLLRSRKAPLSLRLETDSYGGLELQTLFQMLEPHLDRLRSLTVSAMSHDQYLTLFSLFQRPLPILRYVDISYNPACVPIFEGQGLPPDGLFALAPQLRSAIWDMHRFPSPPSRFFEVADLRLSFSPSGYREVFSLFPQLTALRLDNISVTEHVQVLPPNHPLRSLDLRLSPFGDLGLGDPWAHLQSLGFCRVAVLELHRFPARALVSAARDADWRLTSLGIGSFSGADATLASLGSSECRMVEITGDVMQPMVFSKSVGSPIQSLLDDRAWARTMTALTLSVAHFATTKNTWLPLAWGAAPALLELTLVCGTPPEGKWVSLLDPHVASGCGMLDAPRLRVLRVVARADSQDEKVIPPSVLARFIRDHVRVGGGPVPLLRVSWLLRFSGDEADMDTLRAVVDEIEDTV